MLTYMGGPNATALRPAPSSEHFPVCAQELFPGLLSHGLGQLGWPVTAAEFHRLAEALCKLNARRTPGEVSFDFMAGAGRKLQVQILGQQRKDLLAFLSAFVRFPLIHLTCQWQEPVCGHRSAGIHPTFGGQPNERDASAS